MDNKIYTKVEEITWCYEFEKETKVYLLNASYTESSHRKNISEFRIDKNNFISAIIPHGQVPLLFVFCGADNLLIVRELCLQGDRYDVECTLKEIGIKFKICDKKFCTRFGVSSMYVEHELIVGSCGYSCCSKYDVCGKSLYYFEAYSFKAFIEEEQFSLFSFILRSSKPVKTKMKSCVDKMVLGKKLTLSNLRKVFVIDGDESDTKLQSEIEMNTSEFSLYTFDDEVCYKDDVGKVNIKNELMGIADIFITKLLKAGIEGKSREVVNKYFC